MDRGKPIDQGVSEEARKVTRPVTPSRFWVIRLLNRGHSAEIPARLSLRHFLQLDRMGFELHFEAFSYCAENCRQVIHAWIAFG